MESRTQDHISTARKNQAYSLIILADASASETELNWAAVAAFYAAVHAVNAYLWEIARLKPRNHHDRRQSIGQWPALQPLQSAYNILFNISIFARYEPGYVVVREQLRTLVNRHLALIVETIERELPDDDLDTA